MSHIAFDLDALPLVPKVARSAGIQEAVVGWGLTQMWEWCWREKTDRVTTNHLRGFFGSELGAILVDFGFLEAAGSSLWRVRGAARYLRIQEGRERGGRNAKGNLKQYRAKPATPPADLRLTSGLPPADDRLTDRPDTGLSATSDEQLKAIAGQPATATESKPRKPSAQQAFFRWAQAEAARAFPARISESEPDPPIINAQLKISMAGIGRVGLEAAWRAFMLDRYALDRGLPWALFVSKIPELHNRMPSQSQPQPMEHLG
jgi:hypothetical protein